MRTGNIVKTAYGDIVIIVKVSDDYVHWISASHANVSGGTHILTTETEDDCDCFHECCGHPDIDCPDCKGTGKIKKIKYGMDKATYLADNMFEYIKSRMLKNFDF
jgi:hypothetical protein